MLKPDASVQDMERVAAAIRLRETVDASAATLATTVTGLTLDATRDIVMYVHPFGQVDAARILRAPRSGHMPQVMLPVGGTP